MPYETPVTDRMWSDIVNKTTKGYFNLADWERIYGNALYVHDDIEALLGITIAFTTIAALDIETWVDVDDVNALLANINAINTASAFPVIEGLELLRADWLAGPYAISPDYEDVNLWEQTLDNIRNYNTYKADYWIHCGVAAAGQPRFWQARFRSVT